MDKIFVVFFFVFLSFCKLSTFKSDSVQSFKDCLVIFDSKYCIHFEIDTSYKRTNDLCGAGWGPLRAYRFVSESDTVVVSLYIDKYKEVGSQDTLPIEQTKKWLQNRFFKSFGCSVNEYREVNFFFEGRLVSCAGGRINVMEYCGTNHKNFMKNEVGICIESTSITGNESRLNKIMHIIESARVDME